MSDDHSTNTAVPETGIPQKDEEQINQQSPYHPNLSYNGYPYNYDGQLHPPRTGLLRTNYYKRTGNYRPFPTSVAAGLGCVATTLFCLGLVIAGARHTPSSAAFTGQMFFASGLVQIITGIWAIVDNNLFGSVFLLCYGGFFMSLSTILSPIFDITSAYETGETDAIGIFLASWTVFTFFLWVSTWKSTVPLFTLMFCLWMFFLLYTIAVFGSHKGCQTASGVFCFITSACAFYAFYDALSEPYNSYAPLPEAKIFRMPSSWNIPDDEKKIEYV
ncbi:hypothetical protein C6P40_003968 [Pichia californica]|uniref:Uncharacterized protein n=1 Tax=Pichia californica TaxID=460514 RepID=A0A9P7BDX1_9ASCO|nr:hypothetical protein C6P40_003968 [[Candida] californica]